MLRLRLPCAVPGITDNANGSETGSGSGQLLRDQAPRKFNTPSSIRHKSVAIRYLRMLAWVEQRG